MGKLNTLPIELYPIIFKQINVLEIMQLRLVCKRFKYVIDEILKIKDLVIIKFGSYIDNKRWFYLNQRQENLLFSKDLFIDSIYFNKILKKLTNLNYLNTLKLFEINGDFLYDAEKLFPILFKNLKKFNNLELLSIYSICRSNKNQIRFKLNHPNLKIISIDHLEDNIKLKIDCLNLKIVNFYGFFNSLEIMKKDTIKHLEFQPYYNFYDQKINLVQFKNLEFCKLMTCFNINEVKLLNHLTNLKSISYDLKFIFKNTQPFYETAKFKLINLLKEKRELNRNDFKILINNEELKLERQFDDPNIHFKITDFTDIWF